MSLFTLLTPELVLLAVALSLQQHPLKLRENRPMAVDTILRNTEVKIHGAFVADQVNV